LSKTDQKNKLIKLDIRLKTGNAIPALINRQNNRKNGILLVDSGISQAQVSRLEKNALKAMRKNI